MVFNYENIVNLLKKRGYRLTDIRLAIIKLLSEKEHLTLNVLIRHLEQKFDNVNLMSVYNTIDMLIQEHIVFTNTFNGKQIYYEVVEEPSFHLLCDSCKKVIHIKKSNLQSPIDASVFDQILIGNNFESLHYKIEAHGICQNCQKKRKQVN